MTACSGSGSHASDTDTGERLGTAQLAITNAPPDGVCILVGAQGSRSVVSTFDVAPGASTIFAIRGVPTGQVTFTAQAFGATCAAVTSSTVATWVSDAVTATVVVSPPVQVTLPMHRNGSSSVAVDFPGDAGEGAAEATCGPHGVFCPQAELQTCGFSGEACATASTCCRGICNAGVCCIADGDVCTADADCCSGACIAGSCFSNSAGPIAGGGSSSGTGGSGGNNLGASPGTPGTQSACLGQKAKGAFCNQGSDCSSCVCTVVNGGLLGLLVAAQGFKGTCN